jgi:hypothetical protein
MTPNPNPAFPTLDAPAIAVFETVGDRRDTRVGDFLYRAGDDAYESSSSSRERSTSSSRAPATATPTSG